MSFFEDIEKALLEAIEIEKGNICLKDEEGESKMKHYYSTVDNIVMTFSDIEEKNGFEEISVRFERENGKGFDFAEGKLPNNMFYKTYGFSEDELLELESYLRNNAFLIWEIAREKGSVSIA